MPNVNKKFAVVFCYQLITNTSDFHSSDISQPAFTTFSTTEISETVTNLSSDKENIHIPVRTLKENNGLLHQQVHFPKPVSKTGKSITLTHVCELCKENNEKTSGWLILSHLW
jgi:hypothetical protein